MIMDAQNQFSDSQALTDTAASTNVIDLGTDDAKIQPFVEKDIQLFAHIVIKPATCDTVQISVQVDDAVGFGTAVVIAKTEAIAIATLVAGYQFRLPKILPAHLSKRYIRLLYTIVGTTEDTGTIDAGIVLDNQTNGV